jgi:hypothetical protein
MRSTEITPEAAIDATRRWVERAVIGLNLCPFAKAVHTGAKIRYAVTAVDTPTELVEALLAELRLLRDSDPAKIETTLLIHPHALPDFLDYPWFIEICDTLLEQLELDGEIQIAQFHPQFQFEGSLPDDIANYTNRAPFPTLHLLREESVDRAVEAFPDASVIYEKNIATLRTLGHAGWRRLWQEADDTPS